MTRDAPDRVDTPRPHTPSDHVPERPLLEAPRADRARSRSCLYRFVKGTGLVTIYNSCIDVKLILAQRFVRIFAFGLVSLLFAAYLDALGNSETQIGMFFALTLLGDLVIVMILTQVADAIGRKMVLTIGAVSMTLSGVVFATTGNYWMLLGAAIIGVISPSATEVGPFKTIEESALFTLVTDDLVDVLSWYGTAEFSSVALGLVVSGGIMSHLREVRGWDFISACRVVFALYACVGVLKIILTTCMTSRIEAWHDLSPGEQQQRLREQQARADGPLSDDAVRGMASSPSDERAPLLQTNVSKRVDTGSSASSNSSTLTKSGLQTKLSSGLLTSVFTLNHVERILLLKIVLLMATDSCAVGMASVPWQTYYVRVRFHVPDATLGLIFFIGSMLGACGTITSNSIARRLGNIVTLAVTLTPGAIILMLFGLPTQLPWMLPIIFSETFLSPIYIAPRNAFVGRVMTKSKRTASLGIMNMVKVLANASGSFMTGFWADRNLFWLPFVVAGCLKLVYISAFLYTFLAVDRRLEREIQQKKEQEQREGRDPDL